MTHYYKTVKGKNRKKGSREAPGDTRNVREHELLPDHEAELVGDLVEGVVLVDAAAPHAHNVHVRVRSGLRAASPPPFQ
jgi:hypothetical protein